MGNATAVNGHTKPTNPKDMQGIHKSPIVSVISQPVIAELGIAMLEGAYKYGRHNYRTVGVRASIYVDATMRHIAAWWEGEDFDPDSQAQLSHVTKAIASLVVLRDSIIQGNFTDDRPPVSTVDWSALNAEVRKLNEQYPDPVPAHTEKKSIESAQGVVELPCDVEPPLAQHAFEEWVRANNYEPYTVVRGGR